MNSDIKRILEQVQDGSLSVEEALLAIKKQPFADIGYARVDMHRGVRQGAAEVIYGAGKTPEQIVGIVDTMKKNGQQTILITRLAPEAARLVMAEHEMDYHAQARIGIIGRMPEPDVITFSVMFCALGNQS